MLSLTEQMRHNQKCTIVKCATLLWSRQESSIYLGGLMECVLCISMKLSILIHCCVCVQ